jgi:hypothetical protein
MMLSERLADAHQRSVKLYLQRQQIQEQLIATQRAAAQCDQLLVKADGEIEILEALIAETTNGQ